VFENGGLGMDALIWGLEFKGWKYLTLVCHFSPKIMLCFDKSLKNYPRSPHNARYNNTCSTNNEPRKNS